MSAAGSKPDALLETAVEAAITAWQAWLRDRQNASDRTVSAYQRDLRAFLAYLSERSAEPVSLKGLAELPMQVFSDYRAACSARGRAPASIARALATLRNFYRFLDRNGLAHNPHIHRLASPKVPKPPPQSLSGEEARKAVAIVADLSDAPWMAKRDEALFALLYSAGLQLGEVLALNRGQIPEGEAPLTVGTGRKQRQVPLPAFVVTAIAEYLHACPYALSDTQPLFVGARGKRLNPGVVQRQTRRLRALLGLPAGTTPQAFRRSFAERLRAEGGDLRAIQKLLGHAYPVTTRRYVEGDR